MKDLIAYLKDSWNNLADYIKGFHFLDVVDILLVALVLFAVFQFIRKRRAGRLAVGILMLVAVQFGSELLHLTAMNYLLKYVWQVGLVALIILFQPEIRSFLEQMGSGSIHGIMSITDRSTQSDIQKIAAICTAACDMAKEKTGALIVIERTVKLGDVIKSGTKLDAELSPFLLRNIFFNKAPLHDGAVIIRNGRIYAAGCFLPLSSKNDIVRDLGTRHRAAIGMSETSDAVVVVVSEETGSISVACDGELKRNFNYTSLQHELEQRLFIQQHHRDNAPEKEEGAK